MNETFAQFAERIIEILKEADTSLLPDRIIAISKLGAAANDYLGDIKPGTSSEFGQMQSQMVGAAKRKQSKSAKKQTVKPGNLF